MTVLYLEDDPEDQEIFKEALERVAPYTTCYLAANGKEGLAVLAELIVPPDYIFLDINMPAMTGKEFLIEIKNDQRFRGVPVIIYSTSKNPKDVTLFKELGAVDFITKGNSFQEVCNALKRVL